VRVISKRPLREFGSRHPKSITSHEAWYRKARRLNASDFAQLRQTFRSADYVDGVTIFDVAGYHYRIAAVVHYNTQRIYVRQVMTHAEYDRQQ
jgi:mRNA interferase HigB